MRAVFVDTSAWYALVDRADPDCAAVSAEIREHRGSLVTSNFIFAETLALIRSRLSWTVAWEFGQKVRTGRIVQLLRVSPTDEETAWSIFGRYRDHRFSFTDCSSFALMQRLRLSVAITLDRDFRTYGLHCLP